MNKRVGFGLGSNIGDRAAYLARAREALACEDMAVSSLYESVALLPDDAREDWNMPYLNQVVVARMHSVPQPQALLAQIKEIERALGRQTRGHWGPREIDIDLLFIGDTVLESSNLTLPHAQMHVRNFVMLPLADIAPDWVHPILKRSARELADELSREGISVYAN